MKNERMNLWENVPGLCKEVPTITAYVPANKTTDIAVVILPGGGYSGRAVHEGEGYAKFLNENGICAFVCDYRVSPHRFPLPLLDARRAVQFVRYYADRYGINKEKIAIMGSSAGGHLAALTSTYFDEIEIECKDEIENESFIPNAQILCYPVIKLASKKSGAHIGSCQNLLGDKALEFADDLTPEYLVSSKTPRCFVWHTFEDPEVSVINSLDYVKALKEHNISAEFHIFPEGRHGLGLAIGEDAVCKHVSQWGNLLIKWLRFNF